jgi:putative NADH-flavin reductase
LDYCKIKQVKILIFGATGATGHHLVSQALDLKHSVSALVRNPSRLRLRDNGIRIIEGDVSDRKKVDDAIQDQDAVISALGSSNPFKRNPTLINGIRNIATVMEERNVSRFIYQSFFGVTENREELGFLVNNIFPAIVRGVIADHETKEDIIVKSNLSWTIVRCPMLTNGSFTGHYRHGEHITSPSIIPSISRADVADFMLKQLSGLEYRHKKPRIMH